MKTILSGSTMIITDAKARMPSSSSSWSMVLLIVCCSVIICLGAGCAATSTTIIEEEVVTNPKPMHSYTALVIRDFELNRELYSDSADDGKNQHNTRYAKLPGELSEHIERYITSHRIYNKISRDGKPDAATLLLTGYFKRLGRFKISVVASLRDGVTNQEVAYFRETLWDVFDTTESLSQLGKQLADFIDRIQYK